MSEGRLPDFVVIGAHKAGTTSLFHYLDAHPDIHMAPDKELHYFSDHNWDRGMDWYRSNFVGAGDAAAVGEASPGYAAWPFFDHVVERMWRTIPHARLVYILRHPVERLIAHYRHDAFHWGDQGPIETALLDEDRYLSRSRYALQLDRYLERFDRDQILVLISEELRADRQRVMRRAYTFLGVDPDAPVATDAREYNAGATQRRDTALMQRLRGSWAHRTARRAIPAGMRDRLWRRVGSEGISEDLVRTSIDDDLRRAVVERLRDDLERLRHHLGDDFDCWGLLDDPLARPAAS